MHSIVVFGINMIKLWWHSQTLQTVEKLLLFLGGCCPNAPPLSGQKQGGGTHTDCFFELMDWYLAALEIPSYVWPWSIDFLNSIIHFQTQPVLTAFSIPFSPAIIISVHSAPFCCFLCCSTGDISDPFFKKNFFQRFFSIEYWTHLRAKNYNSASMGKGKLNWRIKGKWHSGGCMNSINECNANERIHKRIQINVPNTNSARKT